MQNYLENSKRQASHFKSPNCDANLNMANLTVENSLSQNDGLSEYKEMPPEVQSFHHNPETDGCPSGFEQHYVQPAQVSWSENSTPTNNVRIPSFEETCHGQAKLEEPIQTPSSNANTLPDKQTNHYLNSNSNFCDQARSSNLKVDNLERLWRNEIERPPPCNCTPDPSGEMFKNSKRNHFSDSKNILIVTTGCV